MTVEQLLSSTSSAELGEWIAFFILEHRKLNNESINVESDLKKIFGKPK